MSYRSLVDPQLWPLVDTLVLPAMSDDRIVAIRTALAEQVAAGRPPAAEPAPTEHFAPGEPGDPLVRLLVHDAGDAAALRPALLHIHGGGFVMGSADAVGDDARAFAGAIGGVVVCVDYRLAPETPYPAALHDCYAALRWIHAHAVGLGLDPGRIAILGDSAGGGLAACLAILARDRGAPAIALQVLGMPMLDDRTAADHAPGAATRHLVWREDNNRYGWASYLGEAAPGPDGHAAAARATDLRGLPPAFISVGSLDLFLEEDLAYAARLIAADVPTELHVYPGAVHAFEMMPGADVGGRYRADRIAALQSVLVRRA